MRTLLLLSLFIPFFLPAQNDHVSSDLIYYGKEYFRLEGTSISDSLKENTYDRLPISYKSLVREPVWNLSKSTAGLSIRFLSTSTSIRVKWKVLNDLKMNHMAETGIKGVDLYYKSKSGWKYINTGRPQGLESEYLLIENMTEKLREFKIFLPLYDGIEYIEVGIDSSAVIKKPEKSLVKPIIFYGTSITQGGCASRPGMAHTNIISRELDIDCINLGFSGNGRMELPIAEFISELDPMLYIIECMPNMFPSKNVTNNTIPLVNKIREKNSVAPIIFVELFVSSTSLLNNNEKDQRIAMNKALKTEYEKMLANGYKNIFYIDSKNALGFDNEGTVDGVHFTDLGFKRYSDFLIKRLQELKLL